MRYSMQYILVGFLLYMNCIPSPLVALPSCARYEYLFKIQLPPSVSVREPWAVYYRGVRLPFRGTLALITETKMRFVFSLLVTPALCYGPSCVIRRMPVVMRRTDVPARWFDVSLKLKEGVWSWEITELSQGDMPICLPDHTITLLFDPKLVTVREPGRAKYQKDTTHEGGCALIELPTIVMQGSKEEIDAAACAAQCASLDIRALHESVLCEDRIVDGCCCTLMQ